MEESFPAKEFERVLLLKSFLCQEFFAAEEFASEEFASEKFAKSFAIELDISRYVEHRAL